MVVLAKLGAPSTPGFMMDRRRLMLIPAITIGFGSCQYTLEKGVAKAEFADMPALRGKDYGKTKMRYPDYTETESGLQYKDLRVGDGPAPKQGETVVVDWDGYTIGYYGRIFEARNKTKGGSFEGGDKDFFKFKVGSGQVIPDFEEAISGAMLILRVTAPKKISGRSDRAPPLHSLFLFRSGPHPILITSSPSLSLHSLSLPSLSLSSLPIQIRRSSLAAASGDGGRMARGGSPGGARSPARGSSPGGALARGGGGFGGDSTRAAVEFTSDGEMPGGGRRSLPHARRARAAAELACSRRRPAVAASATNTVSRRPSVGSTAQGADVLQPAA